MTNLILPNPTIWNDFIELLSKFWTLAYTWYLNVEKQSRWKKLQQSDSMNKISDYLNLEVANESEKWQSQWNDNRLRKCNRKSKQSVAKMTKQFRQFRKNHKFWRKVVENKMNKLRDHRW